MEEPKAEVIEFLTQGCKGGDMGYVTLTQFHFVLDEDGDAVPFQGRRGRLGLAELMERLTEFWPDAVRNEEGFAIAAGRPLSAVSLGHGGQLVVSLAPLLTMAEMEAEYRNALFRIEQVLEPAGYRLEAKGFHPSAAVEDIEPVPYSPYQHLKQHLGEPALPLLLGSGRCRVGFQYASEEDAVLKLRIAALLGPVLAFIAENSPVFDAEANADPVLCMGLARAAAPGLGGTVPGLFSEGFGFGAYADWLLQHDLADEHGTPLREMVMDADLSGVVELAQADALPLDVLLGYVALLKGIFYSPTNLEMLQIMLKLDRPGTYGDATVNEALEAVRAKGSSAVLYGRSVSAWVDLLFAMAGQVLGTDGRYLEALQEFKAF
ncbi:MAG: glutamate-cysteine ligase family protein [Coriobacteriales bacterium]